MTRAVTLARLTWHIPIAVKTMNEVFVLVLVLISVLSYVALVTLLATFLPRLTQRGRQIVAEHPGADPAGRRNRLGDFRRTGSLVLLAGPIQIPVPPMVALMPSPALVCLLGAPGLYTHIGNRIAALRAREAPHFGAL